MAFFPSFVRSLDWFFFLHHFIFRFNISTHSLLFFPSFLSFPMILTRKISSSTFGYSDHFSVAKIKVNKLHTNAARIAAFWVALAFSRINFSVLFVCLSFAPKNRDIICTNFCGCIDRFGCVIRFSQFTRRSSYININKYAPIHCVAHKYTNMPHIIFNRNVPAHSWNEPILCVRSTTLFHS